ncbi:putative D-aminoacyl-tRNA deacylase DTD, D-aminoacyl-tRNA deacylase-like superfamily [Helianthus annuus]|nr:putative D-aminoacyl-tRNA deacylase DTD, D-aminoacyl-tRNA deacylase-like superfamily [Helianthus annuus]
MLDLIGFMYRLSSCDGVFGAMMKVNLVNDGPVTMQLESPQSSSNTKDGVEAESTMNGK